MGRLRCSRTLAVFIPCEPISTFLDCSNLTNLKSRVSTGMPDSDSCCLCLEGLMPCVPALLPVCVLGVPSWLLIHYSNVIQLQLYMRCYAFCMSSLINSESLTSVVNDHRPQGLLLWAVGAGAEVCLRVTRGALSKYTYQDSQTFLWRWSLGDRQMVSSSWLRATDLGSGGHRGLNNPTVLERTPAHKPLKQPLAGCLMYIAAPSDLLPQAPFQSYKSDLRVKPWFR